MSTPNNKDRLVISYILALIVVLNLEVSLKPTVTTVSNLIDLDAASQARVGSPNSKTRRIIYRMSVQQPTCSVFRDIQP